MEKWKAEQRDWLVGRLRLLAVHWLAQEESAESVFSPEPDTDRIAKGRTGGCARELTALLKELE